MPAGLSKGFFWSKKSALSWFFYCMCNVCPNNFQVFIIAHGLPAVRVSRSVLFSNTFREEQGYRANPTFCPHLKLLTKSNLNPLIWFGLHETEHVCLFLEVCPTFYYPLPVVRGSTCRIRLWDTAGAVGYYWVKTTGTGIFQLRILTGNTNFLLRVRR